MVLGYSVGATEGSNGFAHGTSHAGGDIDREELDGENEGGGTGARACAVRWGGRTCAVVVGGVYTMCWGTMNIDMLEL